MDGLAAILIVLALLISILGDRLAARQEGADTACATAKECPPDFKAKWVEAGCFCVPMQRRGDDGMVARRWYDHRTSTP
jgi:hypothetical protein